MIKNSKEELIRTFNSLPENARVTREYVQAVLNISEGTTFNWIKAGRLAKPMRKIYGARRVLVSWSVGEVKKALSNASNQGLRNG